MCEVKILFTRPIRQDKNLSHQFHVGFEFDNCTFTFPSPTHTVRMEEVFFLSISPFLLLLLFLFLHFVLFLVRFSPCSAVLYVYEHIIWMLNWRITLNYLRFYSDFLWLAICSFVFGQHWRTDAMHGNMEVWGIYDMCEFHSIFHNTTYLPQLPKWIFFSFPTLLSCTLYDICCAYNIFYMTMERQTADGTDMNMIPVCWREHFSPSLSGALKQIQCFTLSFLQVQQAMTKNGMKK